MKILVTGGTGFVGRNLVRKLVEKGYEIHCIVRLNSNVSNIDKRVKIFRYDGNIDLLIDFFQSQKFDGVVHLASLFLASHTRYDIENLILSNIQFGVELLETCKISNVKWFINTGTFWQNYKNERYNPVNLYAATKEAFEVIAKYYTETSELIFTTIKLNDTYGNDDTRNKLFNLWKKIALSGEVLEMSPGEQIIDICHIDDVINAYELLIEYLNSNKKYEFKNKTYVVTSNERMSLRKLAEVFEKVTNKKLNIKWGARPYREREVMIPLENGEVVPNWKPKVSLEEGIKKLFEEELKCQQKSN